MRVVMLARALIVGAYQRKAEEIAALPGVELTVLVPPRWRESGRVMELERTYARGYDLRAVPVVFSGRFHYHFYPTLGAELRRLRPDVLHVDEEPYNLATFLAYAQAGRRPARLFFTWQNLLRRYPPPFSWMERWVLRNSDAAIAGNAEAVDVLRAKGYRGDAAVIPQLGFDPELFSPAGARPERPFTIGFVGRLEERKGVLDLLAACQGLEGDWRLRYVGGGPLEEALRRGGPRVEVLPWVSSTEVPEVMRGLDVICLPSRTTASWKEQFGRVVVEGMACGAVPVGSSSGEIANLIGDAGLVFPEGDVAALRGCLAKLQNDADLRAELARRGRERFLERFTMARVARATLDVYEDALKRSRARARD